VAIGSVCSHGTLGWGRRVGVSTWRVWVGASIYGLGCGQVAVELGRSSSSRKRSSFVWLVGWLVVCVVCLLVPVLWKHNLVHLVTLG
jgi:hypothetical protein